jgi:chloramphenicol 3-O-phosphotransferase
MTPQLIFIHGPTSVGKYTVARELQALTGFRLFHNHLVVDALQAVFDFASEPFIRLREPMWLAVLHDAAVAGISVIFTFAPEATVSERFVGDAIAAFERAGGEVRFVALTCASEVQEARIGNESRASFDKLRSAPILRELNAKGLMDYPSLPDHGLTIDTGATSPNEAAQRIVEFFGLGTV